MEINVSKCLYLLIILSLTVRFALVLQGLEFLIKNAVVLDDAFIALSIARNVYLGKGYSFNGLEITTLTTTLWTLIISLFGFLSKESLVLFASTLGAVFFTISIVPLYFVVKGVFNDSKFFILLSFLFLFNPFFILISLNALETSLFIFTLTLTFWVYFTYVRSRTTSLSSIFILNFLLFLLILAREEGYLVFLALFFDLLILKTNKKIILEFLLIFLLFTVPQFMSRFYLFGNPLPSSLNALLQNPWLSKHGFFIQRLGVFVLNLSLVNTALGSILLALLGFFLLEKKRLQNLLPFFLYAFFNILFYSLVIPIGNFRYSFPVSFILTTGLASSFYFLWQRLTKYFVKKLSVIIFSVLFSLFFCLLLLSSFVIWTNVRYGGDGELLWANRDIYFYKAAKFLNNHTEKDIKVVASHIGTLQYFLEDRAVVDAGGKVDYTAGSYLNNKEKYYEYFEKKNVSYLVHILSSKQLEIVNKSDIIFIEPIYRKPNEPLAYIKGMRTDEIENYIVILNFKREYLNFFLPS